MCAPPKMDTANNIVPRNVSVQLLVNIILTLSKRLKEANGHKIDTAYRHG